MWRSPATLAAPLHLVCRDDSVEQLVSQLVLHALDLVIAEDIGRIYAVRPIGPTRSVREHYYAISAERRLKHPGVLAITAAAREGLVKKQHP